MSLSTKSRTPLSYFVGPVTLALGVTACGADGEAAGSPSAPESPSVSSVSGMRVLGNFEGEFDGTTLSIRSLDAEDAIDAGEGDPSVSAVTQPLLRQLPAKTYGSGEVSTATQIIALEQQAPVVTEAAWDRVHCGPVPVRGRCAHIKMRNMFTNHLVVNAFFYLQSLTPGPGVTVGVAPVTTTAPVPSLTGPGIPGVPNALWGFGTLGRSTPEATAPSRYVVFRGTATGAFRFTFKGQVIGELR
jgi:hypothetical protein